MSMRYRYLDQETGELVMGTPRPDPSRGGRTRQEAKQECDVNFIVNQHKRGLVTAHVVRTVGEYGFVPASDFRECMERVREAQEVFAVLPAETRKFFRNDPAEFVEFSRDPKNVQKLVELKLAVPKPGPEAPAKVEVVNLPNPPPAA